MKKGLYLLLLFAFGPLNNNLCGSQRFAKRVKRYLEGNFSQGQIIEKEIPTELKTAWPILLQIAKKNNSRPLSYETVSRYVFKFHNLFAPPFCRVKKGIVKKIDQRKNVLIIKTRAKKLSKINFLGSIGKNIKEGDRISFHHYWLIGKS
ncbi:MAG: hypothetical protein AB1643_01985 [Patescibacteria group bacterium]